MRWGIAFVPGLFAVGLSGCLAPPPAPAAADPFAAYRACPWGEAPDACRGVETDGVLERPPTFARCLGRAGRPGEQFTFMTDDLSGLGLEYDLDRAEGLGERVDGAAVVTVPPTEVQEPSVRLVRWSIGLSTGYVPLGAVRATGAEVHAWAFRTAFATDDELTAAHHEVAWRLHDGTPEALHVLSTSGARYYFPAGEQGWPLASKEFGDPATPLKFLVKGMGGGVSMEDPHYPYVGTPC